MKSNACLCRLECFADAWLDWRRAIWFASERTLAVADLHLGYAWVQRQAGLLLPLASEESPLDRLLALQNDYCARQIILLGDVLHRTVELPAVRAELSHLVDRLAGKTQLRFVTGNHDRNLEKLLQSFSLSVPVETHVRLGSKLLLHGDSFSGVGPDETPKHNQVARIIMGHEHPAIRLGDGLTTAVKCPCFVIGPSVLILPAFSDWAAGVTIGLQPFMSSLARAAQFSTAVAILGDRLLPIPIG